MATLKPGSKFKSAVCDSQVMVIKSPAGDHALLCGGVPMLTGTDAAAEGAALDPNLTAGSLIGKRYVNADESLELLCTKGGRGTMVFDGAPLEIKQAKQLPSSD